MRPTLLTLITMLWGATAVQAEVKTAEVTYKHNGVTLQGYFAWDDAVQGRRPGVLVIHEWWGLNDYARQRVRQLAELGYVAFAADMYGEGKTTEHPEEAGAWAQEVRANQQAWRDRGAAGLDVLRRHELVDPQRLAAIGYCFGGSTVLQLAYSGADLDGVVSFHGALTPLEGSGQDIKAKFLICHGAADAFIPDTAVQAFRTGLDKANADYQIVYYGGAQHSFTNPDSDAKQLDNIKYNKSADLRSWALMRQFLQEVFGERE